MISTAEETLTIREGTVFDCIDEDALVEFIAEVVARRAIELIEGDEL